MLVGCTLIYSQSRTLTDRRSIYECDTVILEDETRRYVAFLPALRGCHTQGDRLRELMENEKEAIELYLKTLAEDEKKADPRERNFKSLV